MLQRLIFVLALVFSVSALSAYNLYVSADANPQNADGSLSNPYPSIQQAIDHAFDDSLPANASAPEVKILILGNAGVYAEDLNIDFRDTNAGAHLIQNLSLIGQGTPFELAPLSSTAIMLSGTPDSKLKIQNLKILGIDGNDHRTFIDIRSSNMCGIEIQNCIVNGASKLIDCDGLEMESLSINNCNFHNEPMFIQDNEGSWYESYLIFGVSHIDVVSITDSEIIADVTNPTHLITGGFNCNNVFFTDNTCEHLTISFIKDNENSNAIIQGNVFNNSNMTSGGLNTRIQNNTFYKDPDDSSIANGITVFRTTPFTTNVSISHNAFWNIQTPLMIGTVDTWLYPFDVYHTSIVNNSFINCHEVGKVFCGYSYPYTVHEYKNNFFYGQTDTPFSVINNSSTYIPDAIPISYSYFSAALSPNPLYNVDESSMVYGEPHVSIDYDQHSYELLWDYDIKSPLINAGCPEAFSTSAPERASDPDGTRPDIGAVYYKHKHWDYFKSNGPLQQTIYWLSFPVVDDRSQTNGHYWNEVGMFFNQYMLNTPDDHLLEFVAWSYDGEPESMSYEDIGNYWVNNDYPITQPKGFKIQFRDIIQGWIPPLWVDGFKANPTNTPIELTRVDANNVDFPNWIGYFVPYTQSVEDAFSKAVPGDLGHTYLDYLYSISTQRWNTSRIGGNAGGDWIIPPHRLTLSEGDMVEVKLLKETEIELDEMYWYAFGAVKDPYVRAIPEGFSFKELMDYTPIFIEFDPENTPDEVGVFVGDKCCGAAVVDDNIIEVNLYYQADDAKSEDEISFMFYYADKSLKKAPAPLVYNPETLLFESGTLKAKQIKDFGYVSYLKGEGGTMVPLLTQLNTNYPNPFRDKTNISYILEKEAKISVEIYNLKGQKVKTLYSGMGKKGKHGISWDSTDNHGKKVASGVYFCRLSTPESVQSQKMLLMK